MATYFVGDIQGCLPDLKKLLTQAHFNPHHDQLWLAGDLVARGPESLETLRFVKALGQSAQIILGNHDLHLLAAANKLVQVKPSDRTQPIFEAQDSEELLNWLRQQPILAEHPDFPLVMVHAGISPQWSLVTAREQARKVETLLRSDNYLWLLEHMYGDSPNYWHSELNEIEQLRYTINSFTRMRFCDSHGRLNMQCKATPGNKDTGDLIPWFTVKRQHVIDKTIIFGHWAALMGHQDQQCIGLDTGCVWGNSLTMLRWDDGQRFVTECPLY
jgi:symmetrical bis(5'-nucleosyl)-tetraphosphatase